MSKPWYTLNINIDNAIRSDFDFKKLVEETEFKHGQIGFWQIRNSQILSLFNKEWLAYMESIGFLVESTILFYRKPGYQHPEAHIDMCGNDPIIYNINWVVNPNDDSAMIWYSTPNNVGKLMVTKTNIRYTYWPMDEVGEYEIDRRTIANIPTLVNVSIPHNINVGNCERWAISVSIRSDNCVKNWEDAVEKYKQFIIK